MKYLAKHFNYWYNGFIALLIGGWCATINGCNSPYEGNALVVQYSRGKTICYALHNVNEKFGREYLGFSDDRGKALIVSGNFTYINVFDGKYLSAAKTLGVDFKDCKYFGTETKKEK